MKSEKRTVLSLLGVTFLDQTVITISFPLITFIFFDIASSVFPASLSYAERSLWYGFCIAIPNIINIFFTPILSALSDAMGRKKVLVLEIFAAFVFTFIAGLGVYFGFLALLCLGFFIRGAFAKSNPTMLAMMGDVSKKENKVLNMGRLQFAISLGAFIGPIIGGFFAQRYFFRELNFSLPFFIAASIGIANTCLAYWFLRETLPGTTKAKEHMRWQTFKKVFFHPEVLKISLILFLIQLSWRTYYQFMPPILKNTHGFNTEQLGLFIGMIAFWLMVATSAGIKFLHSFLNIRQMLLVSVYFVLFGLGMTILACGNLIPQATLFIWMSSMPVAAGDVVAYSCLMALYSNIAVQDARGKIMGVGFIIVNVAWALVGLVGGWLMATSSLLPLIIAPLSTILAALLLHANFGKKLVLSYEMS